MTNPIDEQAKESAKQIRDMGWGNGVDGVYSICHGDVEALTARMGGPFPTRTEILQLETAIRQELAK